MQLELDLDKVTSLLAAMIDQQEVRELDDKEVDLLTELEQVHHQLTELSEMDLNECEGGACKL